MKKKLLFKKKYIYIYTPFNKHIQGWIYDLECGEFPRLLWRNYQAIIAFKHNKLDPPDMSSTFYFLPFISILQDNPV